MPVRVDIEGLLSLLEERGRYSLPYLVTAPRGLTGADILADVRSAIAAADASATARVPADPTSSTEGDPLPRGVAAEVVDGPMTDEELRAWLTDLASALDERSLRVGVQPLAPDKRVPSFSDWLDLPPQPAALLSFSAVGGTDLHERSVPADVLDAVLDPASAWARVPRGTQAVDIGLATTVTAPGRAAETVRETLPLDDQQVRVYQFTRSPRRLRFVAVDLGARGSAQVVDETGRREDAYLALLDLLRELGGYLDYAAVRRGQPATPSYADAPFCLGRPLTEGEELMNYGLGLPLLVDHVVDAYVAQVLTDRHLARLGDLDRFEVEELDRDRFLVHARDPDPWLADLNPDPAVLARARAVFAPVQLTRELVLASRRDR